MVRCAVLVAVIAAAACAAAVEPDLSQVTEWAASPVVPNDHPRFAEARGPTCNGGVCAFATGVCCKTTANCCEWGECSETSAGGAKCSSTKEQNALLLAKAFAKNEAQKEVKHEQNLKAKSEQGTKLNSEAAQKNSAEEAEKTKATADEAAEKRAATEKHKANLAKQESDEEAAKTKESASKRASQKAMVDRFKASKAVTFNAGRPFDLKAGKCWANKLLGTSFTATFWLFSKEDDRSTKLQNILYANGLSIWTQYHNSHQRFGFTVDGANGKRSHFRSSRAVPIHAWIHVAARVSPAKIEILINNRVVVRKNLGFAVAGASDTTSRVCAALGPIIEARVSDLRVYNSIATSGVIAALVKARSFDKQASASAADTLIEGPWSPEAGKKIDGGAMTHSGRFTIGTWLRVTGVASSEDNIIHKGDSNGAQSVWINLKPEGKFGTLSIRSGSATTVEYAVQDDKWHHVLYTHGGNTLRLYIDGKQVKTARVPNARPIPDQPLYASNPWSAQTPPAPVIAANLVFAPTVLSDTSIREVMARHYDHDFVPEGALMSEKQSLGSRVVVPVAKVTDSTCRTWAFWVKPNLESPPNAWRNILQKGNAAHERSPAVFFHPSSRKLHFRSATRAKSEYGMDYNEDLPVNVWSHVAMVHCHRKFEVYINSQLKLSDANADAPITNGGNLQIPHASYKAASGDAADVRVWTVALTKQMVHKVYEKAAHP